MKDKEFLEWLRDRLIYIHRENQHVDYMGKLQSIIDATNPEQVTPNMLNCKVGDVQHVKLSDIIPTHKGSEGG
jgi:hypothetical protein